MQVTVGSKVYYANPAAITLLRYRALFGTSFVSEFLTADKDTNTVLVKLVYAAIEDNRRPDWLHFLSEASKQKDFYEKALVLVREAMKSPREYGQQQKIPDQNQGIQATDLDEIRILSMCMECGAPDWLFLRFPVFFVVDILIHILTEKNKDIKTAGEKRYVQMTPTQIRNLYM